MANGIELTTLDHVKAWLAIEESNTDSDDYLQLLIKSASRFALNYMQRDSMAATLYNEMYDGYGKSFMVLRQYPAIDVIALSFNGVPVSEATGNGFTNPYANGFVLEDPNVAPSQQRLLLFGRVYPHQRSSVYVSYRAGYLKSNESYTITNAYGLYQVQTSSTWLDDQGVKLSNGTALTRVYVAPASVGSMQYSVDDEGLYSFNVAQNNATVLISYSFVPPDVEQAVWELVGERYRAQERIGLNSKTLGGQETVSYDIRAMSPYIRELLNPYKRVVPV
jgi:hypothetical protein